MNKYKLFFCLEDGKFKLAQVIECDLKEARRSADELADESGRRILLNQVSVHNVKWQIKIGYFPGKRIYVNDFGDRYCMSKDYSSIEYCGKGGVQA